MQSDSFKLSTIDHPTDLGGIVRINQEKMSYDLSFYKRNTDPISKKDIEEYLDQLSNVTHESGAQWFYQNEDTGVYCSFEYYEPGQEDEELEIESFEGFDDTNFSFNINFIRPQFFGKECFPIVDKLVSDLNLYVLNPQGEEIPKKYEKGILEKEWSDTNLRFGKSNFKEFGLSYLELNKSNYSWEFRLNRNELQNKLGDNYFVPRIFYIQKFDSQTAETICVWPQHIPFVLPKVDYVLIQKKIKKLFKTKDEEGLTSYDDLISRLGKYFKNEDSYMILHPNESAKISKEFNDLPLVGSFENYGEAIQVEKIANIKD